MASKNFIDTYLASLDSEKRATLQRVRAAIRAAAPEAEEGVSYGLPAFILGKPIAAFSASASHCSYFPMSGSVVQTLADELKGFETSKGAVRFPVGEPLPATLVRKLVKARLAEIGDAGAGASKKPARKSAAKTTAAKTTAAKKTAAKKAPRRSSPAKK